MAFEELSFSMSRAAFEGGISLLVAGELEPRRPDNNGPDNRGGETAKPYSPDLSPPGLGSLMLSDGRFNREPSLTDIAA